MRVVFHNPQDSIWYKQKFKFPFKRIGTEKYGYLLDFYINRDNIVYVFLDNLNFYQKKHRYFRAFLTLCNFYFWICYNRMNPFKFKILNACELKTEDFLFFFAYGNLDEKWMDGSRKHVLLDVLKNLRCQKVVHLTHFYSNAMNISEACAEVGIDLFVAENNLYKNSKFFQKAFSWYDRNVYCLPFFGQSRFVSFKPFEDRLNLAIASGTLTLGVDDLEYLSFFNSSEVHPMRRIIYEKRDELLGVLDCNISPIMERRGDFSQKNYFGVNIVDLFNKYRMFVVPEEQCGLPGISFVEGMLCGSVFIGIEDAMYRDLNLIDGLNYIAYDGSLDDLVSKIKYYQNDYELLERISKNGLKWAQQITNKNLLVGDLENYLITMT